MTQSNLGLALTIQSTLTAGAAGITLLEDAITAYRAALTSYTETDHPVDWAGTQNNLAIAELEIAGRETTTDPRRHLEEALAHIDAALTVYDPEHMSYNHAKATELRDLILSRLKNLA